MQTEQVEVSLPWGEWAQERALVLPPGVPYEQWAGIGQTLQAMEKAVHWWIGDWWRYGEREYGESAAQAAPTGFALQTVKTDAWVATKFESSRRRDDLPFSHHVEVAALPEEAAEELLDKAEANNWSKQELRQQVRQIRNASALDKAGEDNLGFAIQPYDVWIFHQCDPRFGRDDYPGRIPGQLVAHALYFWTEKGDVVLDPMAGSGTTIDVCELMGRRCFAFDATPIRDDIEGHDLREGWPEQLAEADLIFWDPPYFQKVDERYADTSVSRLNRDEYLGVLGASFYEARSKAKEGARLAFLMSDYDEADGSGIFQWDYADLIREAGWHLRRQVHVPLSPQQVHPDFVLKFRADKKLARLERYLLLAD